MEIDVRTYRFNDRKLERDQAICWIKAYDPWDEDDTAPPNMGILNYHEIWFSYLPSIGAYAITRDGQKANSAFYCPKGKQSWGGYENLSLPYNVDTLTQESPDTAWVELGEPKDTLVKLLETLRENTPDFNGLDLMVSHRTFGLMKEIEGMLLLDDPDGGYILPVDFDTYFFRAQKDWTVGGFLYGALKGGRR